MSERHELGAWDAGTEAGCTLAPLGVAPDGLAGSSDYFVLGIALGAVLSFGLVLAFVASWLRQLDRSDRELAEPSEPQA